MRRREFIILIGGASAINPFSVWAQQSPFPLIGVLDAADAASITRRHEAFRAGLRELGYIEGRNIRFEYRYADGFLDRLPEAAAVRERALERNAVSERFGNRQIIRN